MKKFIRFGAILCCLVMLFSGCGSTQTPTEPTMEESTMLPKNKTYNILFIGNSYTFYNDMPTIYFSNMAKSCGYDVKVTSITKGAYTLEKFADPTDPYGKMVDTALSTPGTYDFVILQEQSMRPAIETVGSFYDGVRDLVPRIRETGAKPFLYATWGRQEGNEKLTEYNMTNESMTWKLANAYAAIGEELDVPVIHAGLAFYDVYTNSEINLYSADGSHPSPTGSYLVAMTLFCGIFGVDPVEATFSGSATAEEDVILRNAAKTVLYDTPAIPEEYKTASKGIPNE